MQFAPKLWPFAKKQSGATDQRIVQLQQSLNAPRYFVQKNINHGTGKTSQIITFDEAEGGFSTQDTVGRSEIRPLGGDTVNVKGSHLK